MKVCAMSYKLEFCKPDGESSELLNKYFLTKFRKGYVKCKNVVLPEYFTKFGDRILGMDVRSDDIWVCSFPKTGTTWTQEMVWCIAHDADLKTAEEFLPQRFPFLEHSPLFNYGDLMAKDPEMTFPDFVLDSVGYINNYPSPRFIKAHLPFKLLPEKLQENETNAKIVYVARNARDTCVSYFHHSRLLEGYQGGFEQFCQLFLQGNVCFGPFWDHVLGFWEQRNNPNILILRYEEMKKDLKSVIYKTAHFLGKRLNKEQVEKLLDHLSFENMKKNRAVNYEPVMEVNKKYNLIAEDGTFMRCGKVGEWKEFMSQDLINHFEKWENENLKNTNLSFY